MHGRSQNRESGRPPPQATARPRRWSNQRRRLIATVLSLAVHAAALVALLAGRPAQTLLIEPDPIMVELIDPRPLADPVTPLAPPRPSPVKPPPPRNIFRPTPTPPLDVAPLPAGEGPSADGDDELSDAQVASAATAGSGPSGHACNMVRLLQAALRRDPLVQAAAAEAHRGKALMVWNGDWVRHSSQEGAGLAAVREAIMWEVGFAPEACRAEPVRGLVLISLNDAPGSARIVLGSGVWRWSDLLFSRSAGASRTVSRP